jgi:hypothetical protein
MTIPFGTPQGHGVRETRAPFAPTSELCMIDGRRTDMQTGRAIIIAASIVAATGGAAAYYGPPRYSMTNPGGGVSIRLDRRSGDMMGCAGLDCQPIIKGDKRLPTKDPYAGYAIAPQDNAAAR